MLTDTHFHLDLMENMQTLIREFRNADVGVIAVGTTPKAYEKEKQFCSGVDNIRIGLGFHPQLVAERESEIDLFLRLVK
jgi:TatD DNase family protein